MYFSNDPLQAYSVVLLVLGSTSLIRKPWSKHRTEKIHLLMVTN